MLLVVERCRYLIYSSEMERVVMLIVGLILGYVTYLNFPQRFDVNQCITETQTGELYRVLTKSQRDLSFKNHWVFAPMKIEAELVKPNSNTLRRVGDKRFFYPSTDNLNSANCNQ